MMDLFKYVEILQSKKVPSVETFKVKVQYDFVRIEVVNYSEDSYIKVKLTESIDTGYNKT